MILRYPLTSDQKVIAKSLIKVFVFASLGYVTSWLADTDGALFSVRNLVAAGVAAVANAVYSWYDPKDTRYGHYE